MTLSPSGNPAPYYPWNPFAGIITPALHGMFTNAIDSLLMDGACSIPCKLIYSSQKVNSCSNCNAGIYRPGGPVYFPSGKICPVCSGKPFSTVEETDCVNLCVIFDPRKWTLRRGVANDESYAETMCRIELYHKIVSCERAILDSCNACYAANVFIRDGNPQTMGFGKQEYIITPWKRT